MIDSVLTLFKTFVEIIFLRKGPNAIPHSTVLLVVVTAIWFLVGIVGVVIIESYSGAGLFVDLILMIVALGIYATIVNAFGHRQRLLPCITAFLGCSAVISVVLFGSRIVLPLVLTDSETDWMVQIMWLWSIPVEGHIIARSIDRQWVIGFLIAVAVLFAQLQLLSALRPMLGTAT
jgi:hypothetical protein